MQYITRKGGATVTVMVPWDCNNHCPFCINKADYEDKSKFDFNKVLESIKIMSLMTPECDFVFTGGEPLANCFDLEKLLIEVHQPGTNHKVFINTTLPAQIYDEIGPMASYLNFWYKKGWITGINVSRHLNKYVQECDDEIFDLLNFEPRINCVLYTLNTQQHDIKEKLKIFVDRFKDVTNYVQFRKDYVVTTPENLYDEENDEILNLLKETFDYKGPFDQYRMRCGYEFDYEGYKITYHKTLPYSKIKLDEDNYVLYDIIIKQDGTIHDDWDICSDAKLTHRKCDVLSQELDLEAYKNVKYEEYR